MSKISVIMTAKGCANFTELALYCLKNSDISPYEIIFIEQRIGDGNRQLFETFGARIFPAFKPGLAAAWNQGAKMARGDLLMFMHNDALISADTLRVMQETVKGNVAATGPFTYRTNSRSQAILTLPPYKNITELRQWKADVFEKEHKVKVPAVFLSDFCLMIDRRAWEKVGYFDESFSYSGYLGGDYTLRLRMAGFDLFTAPTYAHHNSGSYNELGLDREKVTHGESEVFRKKWGFNLTYSCGVRTELVKLIDFEKPPKTVLEVGCSCGGTLMYLKFLFPQAKLYGIEINESAAKIASLVADVRNMDLETLDDPSFEHYFDCIIAGDVIEHLRDPWQTVKNLAKCLKPGGELIISVPNVMHISNIFFTLNGRWDYRDFGILDRTHLRFFTRQTAVEMLEAASLKVTGIERSTDYDKRLEAFAEKLANMPEISSDIHEFGAVQWFIKAKALA